MLRRFSDGLDVRERGSKGDNKVFGRSHRKARMSFTKMRKASKKLVLRGWYRQNWEFSSRLVDFREHFRHPNEDSKWAKEYTELESAQRSG